MRGCLVHQMPHVCCRLPEFIVWGRQNEKKTSFLPPDALEHSAQSVDVTQRAGPDDEPVCQPAASLRGMLTTLLTLSESLPASRLPSSLCRTPPALQEQRHLVMHPSVRSELVFTVQAERRTVPLNLEPRDQKQATAKGEA